MAQHYSNPQRANDEHALPDVETFYHHHSVGEAMEGNCCPSSEDTACLGPRRWYWQSCFPGCLPDGDPVGPFATEAEAVEDAQFSAVAESDDYDGCTTVGTVPQDGDL